MDQADFRSGLTLRLTVLAARIAELRQKMSGADRPERIAEFGAIDSLQQRYDALDTRLLEFDQEDADAASGVKAEIATMAEDLAGTLDDFVMRIDAGFRPETEGKQG